MKNAESRGTGIYIHIPFCLKKCDYCDFFSLPLISEEYLERYTCGLVSEISHRASQVPGREIETIYIGGGTPSLLLGQQLERIIQAVDKNYILSNNTEISIEANPATLNAGKIKDFQEAGINRLSLGVQSFSDADLQTLTRIHQSRDVLDLIDILHAQGLENFNIDLIYGIPRQSIKSWEKNLQAAVECAPRHISTYLLQLDSQTPMARDIERGYLQLLDEDTELEMYTIGRQYLEACGFAQYEISNFSCPGYECKHNLLYWQAREYLGIGCGAVSFLDARRFINQPWLANYLQEIEAGKEAPVEELEHMSSRQLMIDALILGLRLCSGINLKEFELRFGIDIKSEYAGIINSCIDKELINLKNGQLSLTKRGYFLSNEVFCQFIA